MKSDNINITAQDILASIGFEAQRIAAAIAQHAVGYAFPPPDSLQKHIDRMNNLNQALIDFTMMLPSSSQAKMAGEVKLDCELTVNGKAH